MGHIAKADGKVTQDEINSANHIMSQMQLTAEQREAARKLFSEGKSQHFPLEDVLQQFRKECHRRRNLLQVFMEIQIAMAMADGHLHANEKQVLTNIGNILGFSPQQLEHLFQFTAGASHTPEHQTQTLDDAYAILGASKSDSDAEIKKAYRRLMSQHHPDKLVSKGLPEEMIKIATEKTQEIRKAYELIKNSRK
jgi:DnaJ like chaperone protein